MAAITAKMVSELRAKTGVGMMDCKKALVETNGDFDEAIKVLREKGLSKAAKKADRIAAEGIVDILTEGDTTAMIEVNSETDFVAKNETFKAFVKSILKVIVANKPADVTALLALPYDAEFATVEDKLKNMIYTIGENMHIRRFAVIDGVVSTYIHAGGQTGVVVKFDTDADPAADDFKTVAKDVALQIAANPDAHPAYVTRDQVPASEIEAEKEVIMAQINNDEKNANKPQAIKEKMVLGKLGNFYSRVCLVEQPFVKDDSMTVGKYVEAEAKKMGKSITINSFVIFEKGEGLEKREDNFAEEIAQLTGKAQ